MIKEQSIFLDKLTQQFDSTSAVQKAALKMLTEIGLPNKKSEAYKYTAIASLLEKKVDFSLNENTPENPSFYEIDGSHLVIKNGVYSEEESKVEKGIQVSVQETTEGRHDPLSLINTAFSSDELAIEVIGEADTIFIYSINTIGFSNPRVKVKTRANQEVNIVEKAIYQDHVFVNSYISFDCDKNSKTTYTKVQNYLPNVHSHETIFAEQARDSRFFSNLYSFRGAVIRNNITLNLNDENCEGHMYGLYLLDGNTQVDNNTSVDHIKPNSFSNELYKGILDEKSTGVFNGKIYVRPDAQKTNAFQSNNNILLSDEATVNTKPQLEIWADDVKCSHGCTSGQLDEDAIFYLRTRGIAEKNAKAMILNAFAGTTFAHLSTPELKAELEQLIANKLN